MSSLSYSARMAVTRSWAMRPLVSIVVHGAKSGCVFSRARRRFSAATNGDPPDADVVTVVDPLHVKPRSAEVLERSEFLAKLTGLPVNKFKPFVRELEVLRKTPEAQMEAVYAYLESRGVAAEDILEEPKILAAHPLLVDNYHQCLKELGNPNPALKLIKNYPYIARRRISRLRADGVIPAGDLVRRLLKPLKEEGMPNLENEVLGSIPPSFMREWTLQNLWSRIQAAYLSEKCGIEMKNAVHMLTIIPRARNKSLTHFRENLSILVDLFQFPRTKLMTNSYLLTAHPANMRKIWHDVPSIADLPTRSVVVKLPKLLMCPANNLIEIDDILLRQYKFPSDTVQRMLDVYTLSPATVRSRLSEMDEVPHFQALKFHPRVLRLVVYQNKAKLRLQHLENINLQSVASLDMLSAPTKKFDRLLDMGYGRSRGRDLILLLAAALHVDAGIVKEELHKHQYWCHVPLVDVKATLTLLLVRGFREEQILNSLQLLLYPEDLVLAFLEDVPRKPELQPFDEIWKDNPRVLHLVLYYIERESNFSGNAVFREASSDDDGVHHYANEDDEEVDDSIMFGGGAGRHLVNPRPR